MLHYMESTYVRRDEIYLGSYPSPLVDVGRRFLILLGKLAPGITATHINHICDTADLPKNGEDCWAFRQFDHVSY